MAGELRAQVWAKTDGHCWYCGKKMNPWNDFTIEHMDPSSRGGCDDLGNLVPACQSCNSRKHRKTVEEYRAYLYEKKIVRFWGEQNGKTVAVVVAEEEDEENRPALYRDNLESYMYACLNVGRHYSPGFTSSLLALLLPSLQNYDETFECRKSGEWFFHVETLAAYTRQRVDEVLGHIMTMASTGIIVVRWNTGPQGGHVYVFYVDTLEEESHRFLEEDRAKGETISWY